MSSLIALDKDKYRYVYKACTKRRNYSMITVDGTKIASSRGGMQVFFDIVETEEFIVASKLKMLPDQQSYDYSFPVKQMNAELDAFIQRYSRTQDSGTSSFKLEVRSVQLDTKIASHIPAGEWADFIVDFTILMDEKLLNFLKLKGIV